MGVIMCNRIIALSRIMASITVGGRPCRISTVTRADTTVGKTGMWTAGNLGMTVMPSKRHGMSMSGRGRSGRDEVLVEIEAIAMAKPEVVGMVVAGAANKLVLPAIFNRLQFDPDSQLDDPLDGNFEIFDGAGRVVG